jgi:hypothetical protein
LTLIGVKLREISNLYVLIVFGKRYVSRRPWTPVGIGDVVRDGRRRVRVIDVETRVERRGDVVEHITELHTETRRTARPENVVRMPSGDTSTVAQFIRFHVLVRVYGGDPDAWLAAGPDEADVRFLRWMRTRLRSDPSMLDAIEEMVGTTTFWPSVVASR